MKAGEHRYGMDTFKWLHIQVDQLKAIKRHQHFCLSVKLNWLHAYKIDGYYECIPELAEEVKKYQKTTGQLDRLYISCWHKAHALYITGKIEASVKEFLMVLFLGAAQMETNDLTEFLQSKKGKGIGEIFYAEPEWVKEVNKVLGILHV